MAEGMFNRIALIGLGLIGSSLSHVIRREKLAGHIAGYSRSGPTRDTAKRIGLTDSMHETAADAAADADLVVLCVPIAFVSYHLTERPFLDRHGHRPQGGVEKVRSHGVGPATQTRILSHRAMAGWAASTAQAKRISHGTMREKTEAGPARRSTEPSTAPATLTALSARMRVRWPRSSGR